MNDPYVHLRYKRPNIPKYKKGDIISTKFPAWTLLITDIHSVYVTYYNPDFTYFFHRHSINAEVEGADANNIDPISNLYTDFFQEDDDNS